MNIISDIKFLALCNYYKRLITNCSNTHYINIYNPDGAINEKRRPARN